MNSDFTAKVIKICKDYSDQRFLMRPLQETDYHKGYFELLEQHSPASPVEQRLFERQVRQLKHQPIPHLILIIEDLKTGRVAAQGTLLIQQKLSQGLVRCGHLENLVVDKLHRKNNLGLMVLQALQRAAFEADSCEALFVNPMTRNVAFYKQLHFRVEAQHLSLGSGVWARL